MITLNEIAYNIKNIAYGGDTGIENSINIRQIKHWVHYHRSKLISENINKGILDRGEIYQDFQLNAYNDMRQSIKDYINDWREYDVKGAAQPTVTAGIIENHPRYNDGMLRPYFLAGGYLTVGTSAASNLWTNEIVNNQYGLDLYSNSEDKGNFRNKGHAFFNIPKPLVFDNKKGISRFVLKRQVHRPDDTTTADVNEDEQGVKLQAVPIYYKSIDDHIYGGHNKFTNNKDIPYYQLAENKVNNGYEKYGDTFLAIQNLKVSPNYHGGLETPGEEKLFYAYQANVKMVLSNPVEVAEKGGYNPANYDKYNDHGDARTPNLWDDAKNYYPIPMDMVGDLIQRVIQIEMQTSLKTIPEVVSDSFDDTTKVKLTSGSQVQR